MKAVTITGQTAAKLMFSKMKNKCCYNVLFTVISGAPAAQRAAKRSPITIQEKETHDCIDFLMVIMGSGNARGRVRTTTESRNMAAILQIIA